MTQEEKELLLKDLCARLPYGVIVHNTLGEFDINLKERLYCLPTALTTNFKPYLRPISSMTEEEKRELQNILSNNKNGVWLKHSEAYDEKWEISVDSYYPYISLEGFTNGFNWLNKKMFDYHGLIPMGLALPAPNDMYK